MTADNGEMKQKLFFFPLFGTEAEADVWLCYGPGNKTDVWLRCIQRSRCCHRTAITAGVDEIRDSGVLDVRQLLSLKVK